MRKALFILKEMLYTKQRQQKPDGKILLPPLDLNECFIRFTYDPGKGVDHCGKVKNRKGEEHGAAEIVPTDTSAGRSRETVRKYLRSDRSETTGSGTGTAAGPKYSGAGVSAVKIVAKRRRRELENAVMSAGKRKACV